MSARLSLRGGVILFVFVLCVVLIWTLGINLGLDLKGGLQIVLQVMTDEAVRAETDRTGPLKPAAEEAIREQAVDQAMKVIDKRLNALGVGEMTIQRYGNVKDRQLLLEWPGFEDADRLKGLIQASAVLEMKLVDAGPFPDAMAARTHYGSPIPAHIELLSDNEGRVYALDGTSSVSGQFLRDAYRSRDENGRLAVGFSFNAEGGRRFGKLTEQNIGRSLAVVLDHRVQSVARIETQISDSGIIRGGGAGFAPKEVEDLVVVLKSGELLAPVKYASEEQIGASLGADSIRKGITAAVAALVLVVAFMLFYYRWAGANAVVAMYLNIVILLGAMAYFRAPLTLPGIAGVILTIGVGIDSNVLIFERIREEIRAGKPPVSAVATSFRRVFITLVDTHLAALISAAFLFLFGTGAIRGFAVTLAIGLASNMFTSVFVSKTLFDWSLSQSRGNSHFSI
jgi:preprotein translocase subunit SecD